MARAESSAGPVAEPFHSDKPPCARSGVWADKEIGLSILYLGRFAEALGWFERADQIGPRGPSRWIWLGAMGRQQSRSRLPSSSQSTAYLCYFEIQFASLPRITQITTRCRPPLLRGRQ